MKDKKLIVLIASLAIVLIVLILIILLPLGEEEDSSNSRIPKDVDIFSYEMYKPASCYLADERLIELVRQELSEFPNLRVEEMLFYTEDFEIFRCIEYHEGKKIGVLLDTKNGEIVWTVSDIPIEDIMPDEEIDGGGV